MRTTRAAMALLALSVTFAGSAVAQSEAELKVALEGTTVTVKIDMPASSDGVNVWPEMQSKMNASEYGDELRSTGIGIEAGTVATITLIKVKDEHIEFQLNGGGYGVFGDEMPSKEYIQRPQETQAERDLKEDIRNETDFVRKNRLERDLRDLQDRRERDYQRDVRDAQDRYERSVERVARARLLAGSRFNVRYNRDVPADALTPAGLAAALADFVEFPGGANTTVDYADSPRAGASGGVTAPAPTVGASSSTSLLPIAKGMSMNEIAAVFGVATSCSQEQQGRLTTLTCAYSLEEATAEVTYVNDAAVNFVIVSR